ncbi:CPBP family intramembrane glutamic endopeptidase [Parablautia muri]|uniref:CPBP family intramembrane metalloprotease n=1 Tax=Parablautia muri TaxID=2320879 RepID=A0A9X5GS45_9FIRM|nr:CPBP family intramembrane glutamic endopeptidase [Parablautia muri]NBJ91722.1 CPBP family intramembrane metalloprotease [Parablautia muri]
MGIFMKQDSIIESNDRKNGSMEEKRLHDRRIVLYLAFTFILTFAIEIFVIMPLAGDVDIKKAYMAQLLVTGVMFIPALGVLFTRLLTKEGFQIKHLMLSFNLKGNLKYYGLAWFGFAFLILFGAVLYFVIFPKQFDPGLGYARAMLEAQTKAAGTELAGEQIKMVVSIQIFTGILLAPFVNFLNCFGEEWGWRGYLLPKLLKRFKVIPALLLEGIIWGLWHTPVIIMGHNYGVGYWGFPYLGIFAMCIFCTVLGIILSYLTIKTKSCIPAVIGHGTMNGLASAGIMCTSLENPYNVFLGPMPVGLIGGAGFIFAAAGLLYLLQKEENAEK